MLPRLRKTLAAGLAFWTALACGCGGAAAPGAPEMLLLTGGEFTMGAGRAPGHQGLAVPR